MKNDTIGGRRKHICALCREYKISLVYAIHRCKESFPTLVHSLKSLKDLYEEHENQKTFSFFSHYCNIVQVI